MKPDPAEASPVWETVEQQESTARAAPDSAPAPSLLDAVVEASGAEQLPRISRLEAFLSASTVGQSLAEWLGAADIERDLVLRRLSRDIADIDHLLNTQLNAILHHPRFQKLESSWRGLSFLIDQTAAEGDEANVKVRVLNATWSEVERDFDRALEFDQSVLFRKIYEDEFGMAGGEPFGMMIADYEVHPAPSGEHRHDDVNVLRALSELGARAFCPIIANANPAMLGLDTFDPLERTRDFAQVFDEKKFIRWKGLRESESSRFIGLTLPHVLMRLPYRDDGTRVDRFVFREDVAATDYSKYLWGGANYALGAVVLRAFSESGWLADIRGVRQGEDGGGLVSGLPIHSFQTDRVGIAPKCSTDVVVREDLERELSELGFIPLCRCPDTEFSAFYSNQSVQKPKEYDRDIATVNARISSMLQYILCASRFAHYLKVMGRDQIGGIRDPKEVERFLHDWIHNYVTADSAANMQTKARFPLREARVRVENEPGKPGSFQCTMHLAPHYQLDEMMASVRLVTQLSPGRDN